MRIRTILTAAPAAVLLAAALGAASVTPASSAAGQATRHPGACTSWQIVTTPPVPGLGSPPANSIEGLFSVSALPHGGAWLSGQTFIGGQTSQGQNGGLPTQLWALGWNGSSLTQLPQPADLPAAGPGINVAYDGTTLPGSFDSGTDGWQIMGYPSNFMPIFDSETTFAEHWHHGFWTLTPMAVSPHPATEGIAIRAVAAVSPSDAWVAGTLYAIGSGNLFGATPVGTVIEHWNGTSWSIVPNPAQGRNGAGLQALAVASPSDIWAAGFQDEATGQTQRPLTEHWNGTAWTVVPAPAGQGMSALAAISADGPGDAWAVGNQNGTSFSGPPLVEHWNGRVWATVSLPAAISSALTAEFATLDAVYAASPSDVWAGLGGGVPSSSPAAAQATGDLAHWDGSNWSLVPTGPQEAGLQYSFSALSGTGPDDVWAAGTVSDGNLGLPLAARLSCDSGR